MARLGVTVLPKPGHPPRTIIKSVRLNGQRGAAASVGVPHGEDFGWQGRSASSTPDAREWAMPLVRRQLDTEK